MYKRILLLIALSIICWDGVAQKRKSRSPMWLDAEYRISKYPSGIYFTGFAEDVNRNDLGVSDFMNGQLHFAQNDLTSKIRTEIKASTQTNISTIYSDGNYKELQETDMNIHTLSEIELVNSNNLKYYDSKKKRGYVFVFVQKNDLVNYYNAEILNNLTSIQAMIDNAALYMQQKEKLAAKSVYQQSLQKLKETEWLHRILRALEGDKVSGETYNEILNLRTTIHEALKSSNIQMYVATTETNLNDTLSSKIILPKVKEWLSDSGYIITENRELADFCVKVNSYTTMLDKGIEGIYFAYFSGVISVNDNNNGNEVFNTTIDRVKGAGLSFEQAGIAAYLKAQQKIAEALEKYITTQN